MVYATGDGSRRATGCGSGWSAAAAERLHRRGAPAARCGSTTGSRWSRGRSRPTRRTRRASAAEIGLAPDRSYADWREMARAEAARPDGIEAVAIVTPNHLHAPIATAFLEAGIDVICDKPLAMNVAEAEALVALTRETEPQAAGHAQQYRLRHGAAGARDGGGGRARADHRDSRRLHPGLADAADRRRRGRSRPSGAPIRRGPGSRRCSPTSACMPSTSPASSRGATAEAVAADLFTAVPGRRLDDNANVLVRWTGGARGTLIASQTSPGHYNDLSVHVYGDKAGLEWSGARPEELRFSPRTARRRGRWSAAATARSARAGRCRGCRRRTRRAISRPSPTSTGMRRRSSGRIGVARRSIRCAGGLVPDVADGLRGVKFVAAAVASSAAGGGWREF